MEETIQDAVEIAAIYDSTKSYQWQPDTQFPLTGTEFGFLYNVLKEKRAELERSLEMIHVMESKLKEAVELGTAKEMEVPPVPTLA